MVEVILFYKFLDIENPSIFKEEHQKFCLNLGVKGRVLIATEGINGSISGDAEQIAKYQDFIQEKLGPVEFKRETALYHPFDKIVTKIKNEIIRIDKKLDLTKVGKHLSPEEFLEVYNDKNTVILDTRNDYEVQAGKFRGAINPKLKTFREFPSFVDNLKIPKDARVVMYCTGGIRCEKASAYMIEKGFTNVSQLHGGIINFVQKLPDTVWEGSCFVFDKRLTSTINQDSAQINNCVHCSKNSDQYRRCKNSFCNKLIFLCPDCQKSEHNCCSKACKKILLKS